MSSVNILVAGVGGQGIITFGKVVCDVCNKNDIEVLMAETHGLSQRGGTVVVHIRIGDVYSPLIPFGDVDVLVSLEFIEAFRYLRYVNKHAPILVNTHVIRPPLPRIKLPDMKFLMDTANSYGLRMYAFDAHNLALQAGNSLSLNMVMLGGLVALDLFPNSISFDDFREVIESMRMSKINWRAFNLGYNTVKSLMSK